MNWRYCIVIGFMLWTLMLEASELVWPLDNTSFARGSAPESYLQPTESGHLHSAVFGNVREGGARFHEGIDLKSLRKRKGVPLDRVLAVLPGTIAYINRDPKKSSYGKYIVIEHDEMAMYSLYAHLKTIGPKVKAGVRVQSGSDLGRLGHTAGGYHIPQSRAHLHFEMGFRLSDAFQDWYERQAFKTANDHGVWNGMNLVGLDPLELFKAGKKGVFSTLKEYVQERPIAFELMVRSKRIPDFVKRYPELLRKPVIAKPVAWKLAFTWDGVPLRWEPIQAPWRGGEALIKVLSYHKDQFPEGSGRQTLQLRKGQYQIGRDLRRNLEILFPDLALESN